jgi:hypothetical protein
MPGAAVRKEVLNFANTAMVIQVWGLIRFGVMVGKREVIHKRASGRSGPVPRA